MPSSPMATLLGKSVGSTVALIAFQAACCMVTLSPGLARLTCQLAQPPIRRPARKGQLRRMSLLL